MRAMSDLSDSTSPATSTDAGTARPDGFQRVCAALRALSHEHEPRWLEVSARSSQEAADALGVALGQIAKSVVFRRKADDAAVLVIASGDKRVDERKLEAHTGKLGRADADYVKARTGFSIGGVSPLGFQPSYAADGDPAPPLLFIDQELFRFDAIWAAAGHPNGVFLMSPPQLVALTGAPVIEVAQ
jgi:prolyl-tRNA editing enzyme YbaK/EbsC (Cys-tRNA(Pro) deacylase)